MLKDPIREKRIFTFRAILAMLLIIVMASVLVVRVYYLQVVDYEHYTTLSDKNRMQLQSVAPTRGLIYDRNGILLADNQPVFSVSIVKERVEDLEKTIAKIGSIIELSDEQIKRFDKRLNNRRKPYEPVPLKSKLSEREIARLSVNRHLLPGVEVEAELVRNYPYGELMAHMLGYVGRINIKELKRVDAANYSATNYIGKLGVEKFYEDVLHGKVGHQTVETNARGRVLRVLDQVPPLPGRDITLSIDVRLQQVAVDAMGGRRGAVVAINPETGGILALVSTPSFDPNLFVTGIDHKSYASLRDSLDIPLFNRALKGQYPPGSTIKPIIGLAGLDTAVVNRQTKIQDPGWYQLKNDERFYRDWKRYGHGVVDLYDSIVESCDTFFYDMAFKLGVDRMSLYLEKFGIGSRTAIDIDEDRKGILPSRGWKRGAKGLPWFPGDSLNMGIGQGFMLTTPLQLATATAVLANRGRWHRPHLALEISEGVSQDESVEIPRMHESEPPDVILNNPDDWDYILGSMKAVMHGKKGTARSSGLNSTYKMAGKTGTAQVVGIKQGERYDAEALAERHRDHALFVGFAPYEMPKIAVAIIVENGGGGGSAAAPVARKIFDAWVLDFPETDQEEASSSVILDSNSNNDQTVAPLTQQEFNHSHG
ncbi:penicillin-binding protein 2 [Alkalimarinus sediminis]|uniref:Peptidoglycan D,D-transpeptidase MrdA n=1 Tax=Alkalimarinus sediminis TaxID=1632866 RepID=A0A9E8HP03_9ALTE|nr:penicillin-binding protein 2 [Alkalimarinus sediminis]UZW73811.1 penicillin-binding protein 2 [Alkalimarinus sediminis]